MAKANLYTNEDFGKIEATNDLYQNEDIGSPISKDPTYGNIENEEEKVYLKPNNKSKKSTSERVEKRPKRRRQRNPRNPVISRYDEDNYSLPNLSDEPSRKNSVGFNVPRFSIIRGDSTVEKEEVGTNPGGQGCRKRYVLITSLIVIVICAATIAAVISLQKNPGNKTCNRIL